MGKGGESTRMDAPAPSAATVETLPITVVVPAFDRADLLPRALAAVAAQAPLPAAEVIVVDDASSDETGAVAESFGARVIRHDTNQGAAAARNTGIAAAGCEWVALLDSDDEWLPGHLHNLWSARGDHVLVSASALTSSEPAPRRVAEPVTRSAFHATADPVTRSASHATADPVTRSASDATAEPAASRRGDAQVIGAPDGKPVVIESPAALIYPGNSIVATGAMVRRDVVRSVGGFDTDLRYAEDFDLWLRVLEHGTAIVSPKVTCIYRRHSGQKSTTDAAPKATQSEIVRSYGARPWWSPALADKREAVRAYDELGSQFRSGRRAQALRRAAWIAARPRRLAAVAETRADRRRRRRAAERLDLAA